MESTDLARHARAHALRMVHRAKASHIGAALSMIDILAVLYADAMRVHNNNTTRCDAFLRAHVRIGPPGTANAKMVAALREIATRI